MKSRAKSPAALAGPLLKWYDRSKRDLPWRVAAGHPDPYHVLVSEAMLQQTQVATVVPYFHRFLAALPTVVDLAAADEQVVLRLWQGLGYYSRARNLRKAAITVVEQHNGRMPSDVETLLTLPGVGRYTAGAIASLAYDTRAPILDGNVIRVLCRLDAIEQDPRTPTMQKRLWVRAEEILPQKRAGDFNSALMELGATVCTPRNPQCLICPVASQCTAYEKQLQNVIPPPKKAKETPLLVRHVLCLRDGDGRFLVEQRPTTGRWAGMWQFITRPSEDFTDVLGTASPKRINLGIVRHALTHRRYAFHASAAAFAGVADSENWRWATPDELHRLPFSRPHLKIRALAEAASLPSA